MKQQLAQLTKFTLVLIGVSTLQLSAQAQTQANYTKEYKNAIQLLMNNLQSNGGVVAAPSHTDPDYFYDWVRDTALTMKEVIQLAYDNSLDLATRNDLKAQTEKWVSWEIARQLTPKYVDPTTGVNTDLGEPRFLLTGLTNMNPWGRPQNDGPALRALTAMTLATHWISEGRMNDVQAQLYSNQLPANTMIKRDLEYVATHWTSQSVDLWEEEYAMHFYTLTVQKVALMKGAILARTMNDSARATYYQQQANAIENYLTQFYDAQNNVIQYALKNKDSRTLYYKTSPLDVAVLLAAIQTFDGKFYVNLAQMVPTVNQLVSTMQGIYNVNKVVTNNKKTHGILGTSIGRYPADRYNGDGTSAGNPWFLGTIALAEFSCDLKKVNYTQGSSIAQLDSTKTAQFNRVLYHMNASGELSEQFNRDNGYEQGAHDLTWSYTSYISAYRACF